MLLSGAGLDANVIACTYALFVGGVVRDVCVENSNVSGNQTSSPSPRLLGYHWHLATSCRYVVRIVACVIYSAIVVEVFSVVVVIAFDLSVGGMMNDIFDQ